MENKKYNTPWGKFSIQTRSDMIQENPIIDVYGLNTEQLTIWNGVQREPITKGTIDTADATIPEVNNIYNLNLSNPDWEVLSMTFNGVDYTFKVWPFANETLAYETLADEIQTVLWETYSVEYIGSGNITIVEENEKPITYSNPNLVRDISFSWWFSRTAATITIDGVDVFIDWQDYSNANTALNYFTSQIDSETYYFTVASWDAIQLARKDATLPVILIVYADRYTYDMQYRNWDTPFNERRWTETITTIDGVSTTTPWFDTRNFKWDHIIRNVTWLSEEITSTYPEDLNIDDFTRTDFRWNTMTPTVKLNLNSLTKNGDTTATRAVIRNNSGTILHTANFVWNEATFNVVLEANTTYQIGADSNWAWYIPSYRSNLDEPYNWWGGTIVWDNFSSSDRYYCIQSATYDVLSEYTGYNFSAQYDSSDWPDSLWKPLNATSQYFDRLHNVSFFKDDYSQVIATSVTNYSDGYTDAWKAYSFLEVNNQPTILNGDYTPPTQTFSRSSNNYFIQTNSAPVRIEIEARSANGNSYGQMIRGEQECTAQYGSTTEIVPWKIFKTDENNSWDIVALKRGWFVLNWDTTTSNKLNWTCTS